MSAAEKQQIASVMLCWRCCYPSSGRCCNAAIVSVYSSTNSNAVLSVWASAYKGWGDTFTTVKQSPRQNSYTILYESDLKGLILYFLLVNFECCHTRDLDSALECTECNNQVYAVVTPLTTHPDITLANDPLTGASTSHIVAYYPPKDEHVLVCARTIHNFMSIYMWYIYGHVLHWYSESMCSISELMRNYPMNCVPSGAQWFDQINLWSVCTHTPLQCTKSSGTTQSLHACMCVWTRAAESIPKRSKPDYYKRVGAYVRPQRPQWSFEENVYDHPAICTPKNNRMEIALE